MNTTVTRLANYAFNAALVCCVCKAAVELRKPIALMLIPFCLITEKVVNIVPKEPDVKEDDDGSVV